MTALPEDEMLKEELGAIKDVRTRAKDLLENIDGKGREGPYMIGLALSGGGIRSATVSLGVMQKLADIGLLKHVDYLSTVSGGGYIGSALTWWLRGSTPDNPTHQSPFDTGKKFPFTTLDPRLPESTHVDRRGLMVLRFLRSQGNYLIPGNGITLWSSIAIVLRAILLNLMIWIPVTALVMGVLYALGYLPGIRGLPYAVQMAAPGTLETTAEIVGTSQSLGANDTIPPMFLLMLVFAIGLAALFVMGSINHSLLSWTGLTETELRAGRGAQPPAERPAWYSWPAVGIAGLLDVLLVAVVLLSFMPVVKRLFANSDAPAAAPGSLWTSLVIGLILWAIITLFTLLCFRFMGKKIRPPAIWHDKTQKPVFLALGGLIGIAVAGYVLDCILAGSTIPGVGRIGPFLLFLFAVAYLIFVNYLIGLLIRHLLRNEKMDDARQSPAPATQSLLQYRARRTFEWFYGRALSGMVVLIIIGTLPLVGHYIEYGLGGTWTALGLAFTLGGQLWSRVRGNSKLADIAIVAGAALFAYGVLLIGHRLAVTFMDGEVTMRALIAGAVIVAVVAGWFVNTNQIGLHRFYRDRLMEAFLPDNDALTRDTNAAATRANDFKLTDCWDPKRAKGPYQIINTNMVLAKSQDRKYRQRGGDNFILTPQFIGSNATEWYRTEASASSDMTLASAMAISGAAANPRGGAGGRGLTRSATVSLVMSLLNIRLGFWIPNPKRGDPRMLFRRPNHFWPGGLYALTPRGYLETSKWLELADGGHFENLAVYELVRRRCGLIIVCDGGQDNASSYADLVTAVQRVGQDFGATVHFDMAVRNGRKFEKCGPAQMIAKPTLTDYPKGAEFAEKGYFVARIDYGERGGNGWPKEGIVIYLKSALIRELAVGAKGYRGANPDFPNQTTGDQFFDEEQFEAYREVGFRICEQMVTELGLTRLFGNEPPSLDDLRQNSRYREA